MFLYSTFGASHLSVCDLRHSLLVECIPIVSKNIFYMLTQFKCLVYSGEMPIKTDDLVDLLHTVCNYKSEDREIIMDHNKNIFKNNFKKNWVDEILKLRK